MWAPVALYRILALRLVSDWQSSEGCKWLACLSGRPVNKGIRQGEQGTSLWNRATEAMCCALLYFPMPVLAGIPTTSSKHVCLVAPITVYETECPAETLAMLRRGAACMAPAVDLAIHLSSL